MNKPDADLKPEIAVTPDPLALLRRPFPDHQVSKLPKPTKAQTDAVRADFKAGVRCKVCGAWHHPDVVHLDYVGHAALTDRLLDTDPLWTWEPVAFRDGLPAFDQTGGLWIKLTVCGVTRLGYGHAAVKPNQDPGAREKEVIGDSLRNAAIRFGAALDLWHKGDLHLPDKDGGSDDKPKPAAPPAPTLDDRADKLRSVLRNVPQDAVEKAWGLAAGLLALLSVENPVRLDELTTIYEGRKPKPVSDGSPSDHFDISGDEIQFATNWGLQ